MRNFLLWVLSETIGALALVPLGLLFKPHYLLRHRNPQLLLETLVTMVVTLVLSWVSIRFLPWPFTAIIVLLMWSAVRLPRMEAFMVFLVTVMMVSLMIATNPIPLVTQNASAMLNAPWLPFLMMLLPANVMTMVMYAFRAERKHITESEERFRNAMEYSAIGMALVGTDGQWLQANKALCQFLGYSQSELHSLTFQQVTWPEDLNADVDQMNQLIRGEINSYSMEKRYYTRNGEVVWALLAVSLVRHADGTPLYFIAQIEDINDLKQTEWVNKRLMERITLANEAGGIGIWEWDVKPDIISWDKRMFELYDIPPHIKPTWQVWHECILPEDRAGLTEVLVTGMLIRWISVNARPIAIGAKPAGAFLSVAPWITSRKPAVSTISITMADIIEKPPGECSPKPFEAKPLAAASKPALPLAIIYRMAAAIIPPTTCATI
jgi:PAS domain S-box-containing protein